MTADVVVYVGHRGAHLRVTTWDTDAVDVSALDASEDVVVTATAISGDVGILDRYLDPSEARVYAAAIDYAARIAEDQRLRMAVVA